MSLLEQASLVLIPSGYKEDTVYSVIPSNGSGDMSFTRASDGTRINSDGLVENTPYNLLSYSEDLSNAVWGKINVTINSNTTVAPNGTTTADTLTNSSTGYGIFATISVIPNQQYTFSFYIKKGTNTSYILNVIDASTNANITLLNYSSQISATDWVRITSTFTIPSITTSIRVYQMRDGASLGTAFLWGAQLNIGSTAKPYFPTTDRLNVPRLTYQNGGGGCPSLLLEPQRTNIATYSQEFNDVTWIKTSVTVTANTTVSPDGTQNADTLSFAVGGGNRIEKTTAGVYNSQTHTITVYAKVASGTSTFRLKCTHAGVVDYISTDFTATTSWQRFTFTQTFGATIGTGIVYAIQNGTNGLAKDIIFWGFQLETNSSYATSYIPTVASSATRIADACSKTGISSLIGQTEGVLFADFVINGRTNDANILNSEKNTVCSFFFLHKSNGNIQAGLYQTGAIKAQITAGSVSVNQRAKVAYAYKSGNTVLYINGVQVGTSADTYTLPSTLDDIFINDTTTYFAYQESVSYNQVILFPTRLTNAQLATLTTI